MAKAKPYTKTKWVFGILVGSSIVLATGIIMAETFLLFFETFDYTVFLGYRGLTIAFMIFIDLLIAFAFGRKVLGK